MTKPEDGFLGTWLVPVAVRIVFPSGLLAFLPFLFKVTADSHTLEWEGRIHHGSAVNSPVCSLSLSLSRALEWWEIREGSASHV
ncbi:hypothetical protein E2C01_079715 [Portunus trituberculatus]|uniref:Uncharacterized protein n=1 Tax=Portunus trituberculatus TaxID=210409 RepID=A0A5B7IK98_PORTR|nr:hypothetical protein [Portunus trituberculatus]